MKKRERVKEPCLGLTSSIMGTTIRVRAERIQLNLYYYYYYCCVDAELLLCAMLMMMVMRYMEFGMFL